MNKLKYTTFPVVLCFVMTLTGCSDTKAEPPPTETMPTFYADAAEEPQAMPETVPTEELLPETFPQSTEPLLVEDPFVPEMPDSLNNTDFVLVTEYIPDILVELKYATSNNYTDEAIYDFEDVYLRAGTVKKLMGVQEELRSMGLGLKIWDGFRPISAQWKLWKAYPDPNYVSHPETGHRSHCRGNTFDVTLVDEAGMELEMPSAYDDFTAKADRDYSDCTDTAACNAGILQYVMEKYGFHGIASEWWHYSDETPYPVDEEFEPIDCSRWYAVCQSYINLRAYPDSYADSLAQIPRDEEFLIFGWYGDFGLAQYRGKQGYVHRGFIGQSYE